MGEVAPAELAQKGFGGMGRQRSRGSGMAKRVPDLARRDLAPMQVRREARGAVPIGPVAVVLVGCGCTLEEVLEPRGGAAFAGRPGAAQAGGRVRLRRQQAPVGEVVAPE